MKHLVRTLLLILATTTFSTNAVIINADTIDYNAFKDTDTGLVWLDFGENNGQTYDYVTSQLSVGSEWFGWRLPTISEVYAMWTNLADLDNVAADVESPDNYGVGQFLGQDTNSGGADDSVWDITFDIIGYNSFEIGENNGYVFTSSLGLFEGTNGLSYVLFNDFVDNVEGDVFDQYKDSIGLVDNHNWNSLADTSNLRTSTLLVRNVVSADVPEPFTLGVLVVGLLGLLARRKEVCC